MQSDNRELWAAFTAVIFITLFYFLATILLGGTPRSSGLVGHGIGIVGFILMVMTEVLYSWRKRSRRAHWGRMSQWLNFHIFTGIVGPYMVLLHTAWNFSGLAGVAMLLTMVIVISGFIGRYIYTAVPRTADGIEVEASQLQNQMDVLHSEFENWAVANPQTAAALEAVMPAESVATDGGTALIFTRTFEGWRQNRQWRASLRRLDPKLRTQADQYERLVRRQQTLRRQVASLAMARRTLALWHAIHVPIGMALFTAAIIHIVAAFYFATLLR